MDKQDGQKHRWNILIEIELYPLLKDAENDLKKETLLVEYCETRRIPVQYARSKIERMKQLIVQAEQETVEHDGR